jgi:hypothetical protein
MCKHAQNIEQKNEGKFIQTKEKTLNDYKLQWKLLNDTKSKGKILNCRKISWMKM